MPARLERRQTPAGLELFRVGMACLEKPLPAGKRGDSATARYLIYQSHFGTVWGCTSGTHTLENSTLEERYGVSFFEIPFPEFNRKFLLQILLFLLLITHCVFS